MKNKLLTAIAFLLLLSAFFPLGTFHSFSWTPNNEPSTNGVIWNFLLPSGWIAFITGLVLLAFPNRNKFKQVLQAGSILIILLLWIQPLKEILLFYTGTTGELDIDYYGLLKFVPMLISSLALGSSFWLPNHSQRLTT